MQDMTIVYAALTAITLTAMITDCKSGLIPNWLTLPVLLAAPAVHLAMSGVAGLVGALLGLLICGSIPLLFHRMGAMGGGDVKLFAAIGALTGPGMGLEIQLLSLSVTFFWGLGVMAWRGKLLESLRNSLRVIGNSVVPAARRVPIDSAELTSFRLGAAIFAGSLMAITSRALMGGLVP